MHWTVAPKEAVDKSRLQDPLEDVCVGVYRNALHVLFNHPYSIATIAPNHHKNILSFIDQDSTTVAPLSAKLLIQRVRLDLYQFIEALLNMYILVI